MQKTEVVHQRDFRWPSLSVAAEYLCCNAEGE